MIPAQTVCRTVGSGSKLFFVGQRSNQSVVRVRVCVWAGHLQLTVGQDEIDPTNHTARAEQTLHWDKFCAVPEQFS